MADSLPRKPVETRAGPAASSPPPDCDMMKALLPSGLESTCLALAKMTDVPVLILGETGTGKGMLVKHIVKTRRQLQGKIPFVAMSCASLNSEVAEATLFGHRRGAYTGAHEEAVGAVGSAHGGVLFLDEVHCLSLSTQRKLLRLLDDGAYSRVGESLERKASLQLVVATNQDLDRLMHHGEFLLDLLMRIKGITIDLPPLRERREEIPALIALYADKHRLPMTRADIEQLVGLCLPLHWPGNIRQLNKSLDAMRFKALREGESSYARCFTVDASMMQRSLQQANKPASGLRAGAEHPRAAAANPASIDEAVREILRIHQCPVDLGNLLEVVESSLIRYALSRCRSISEAMGHLRLSRGKLDSKRRKYKLMGVAPYAHGGD